MKITQYLSALLLLIILGACGGSESEENSEQTEDQLVEKCTYSYNPEATTLTWTAFKLSDKIGVDGTFNEIKVTTTESDDMFEVLNGATFEIPVNSISTQDTTRDYKIKNSFFGNMNSTEMITGTINSIDKSGATVSIVLNGITKEYDGEIKVDGERITLKTSILITDFDAQVAMDSLSVVCEAKHTGTDGKNKLWEDVDIAVSTILDKTCE